MTATTITRNEQYNSFEITFAGKPDEQTRNTLKANGYRWHGQRKIWYGYKDIADQLNGAQIENDSLKTQNSETTSRLTYTAYGIKGKDGEIIGGVGDKVDYLPAYYDFNPVKLELRLTIKSYKHLAVIPNGCTIQDDSDIMTDYFEYEQLIIPATAGAEFLAAAIGYKKYIEVMRKKGAKCAYYANVAENEDRNADALTLAEQIASGKVENGAEIIAERIRADKEQHDRAILDNNRTYAAELLAKGAEQRGDLVIHQDSKVVHVFDFGPHNGEAQTLYTVIAINTKTGERRQVTDATKFEAEWFYKGITTDDCGDTVESLDSDSAAYNAYFN